eukprot:5760784-Amphidinium_carterae.1
METIEFLKTIALDWSSPDWTTYTFKTGFGSLAPRSSSDAIWVIGRPHQDKRLYPESSHIQVSA